MRYLLALFLTACTATSGYAPPSETALARVTAATASARELASLAEREAPTLSPALRAVADALDTARLELESGRPATTLTLALGTIDATLARQPGGALEAGLITVKGLIAQLVIE